MQNLKIRNQPSRLLLEKALEYFINHLGKNPSDDIAYNLAIYSIEQVLLYRK